MSAMKLGQDRGLADACPASWGCLPLLPPFWAPVLSSLDTLIPTVQGSSLTHFSMFLVSSGRSTKSFSAVTIRAGTMIFRPSPLQFHLQFLSTFRYQFRGPLRRGLDSNAGELPGSDHCWLTVTHTTQKQLCQGQFCCRTQDWGLGTGCLFTFAASSARPSTGTLCHQAGAS